jgi:hypothetical protein
MAYTINKTDGTILTTVSDGTLDTTTNLSLFGKNYAGYGEALNENQVKLLENFANTTANAPNKAIKGQLFYDTTLNQMQVYNGTAFKAVSGSIISTSEPSTGAQGDLWYDSTNEQLYVYTSTQWVLVGPAATAGAGVSGGIVQVITDDTGTDRVVIQLTTSDTIVAIVSAVEFTPQTAISGFATIYKGVTLSTAITGNKFTGTATDSDKLGGVAAANFVRADTASTSTNTLTIQADTSLVLGADGDITFNQDGDNFRLTNSNSDGNIVFRVNDGTGGGGAGTTALTINGANAGVTVANNLTVSGSLTVSGTTTTVNATNTTIEDPLIVLNRNAGSIGDRDIGFVFDRGINTNVALIWDESADSTTNPGGEFALVYTTEDGNTAGDVSIQSYADLQVNTLTGTATQAQYADLAERYEADSQMEAGDIVKLGGEKEITKTASSYDSDVFGVISANPGVAMNIDAGDNSTHPFVAFAGRLPCKVKGPIAKGDRITTSDIAGVGQKAELDNELCSVYNVIGRSLESIASDEVETIEIVVGKQ